MARAGQAPDRILVPETMSALAAFCSDRNALLTALRQLIARQPASTGIVCLGAHMLHGLDACAAGWELADRFMEDESGEIAESVAYGEAGGTEVIDSLASGPGQVLCPAGTPAWIKSGRTKGRSIVVVTPFGSRLPAKLWKAYLARNGIDGAGDQERSGLPELVDLDRFDDLIDADGVKPRDEWVADCPDVAELARG